MKLYNIDNGLSIIAQEWTSKKGKKGASLELRGQFAPKSLNVEIVRGILDNRKLYLKILEYFANSNTTPELFQVGEYIVNAYMFVDSKHASHNMCEIVIGTNSYYNPKISTNVVSAILSHEKELRVILQESTPEQLENDEKDKAQKELKKNSVNMPTDKKSAHDSKIATNAPALSSGILTIESWLEKEYPQIAKTDIPFYALDVDAQLAYSVYVKENSRPTFAAIKAEKEKASTKPAFNSLKKESANAPESSAAIAEFGKATGKKFDSSVPTQKKTRGKAVAVSFDVRLCHNNKTTLQKIKVSSWKEGIEKLQGMTLANFNPDKKDNLVVTGFNPTTSGADKYLISYARQGYLKNFKRDDGKAITLGNDIIDV